MLVGRLFGFKGILVMLGLGGVLWVTGLLNPTRLLDGASGGTASSPSASPQEQERFNFAKVVLAGTEDVWTAQFAARGRRYEGPVMTVFRRGVRTGCGAASAAMGPFYCPEDQKIYIDLGFYDELEQTFHSPGDFAQAYVIAHEVAHHVQKLDGIADKVAAMRGRPESNEYSVRLELQADFLAGVWAHHSKQYLEHGDIEEAMRAANAIGDDAIQGRTQGRVIPHSFTHGTSQQRMRWFKKGLDTGRMEDGDTFSISYNAL